MIRVGLTGSLGAGKSTMGRLFEEWGAVRVDADELAREAVRPGTAGWARIRRAFGEGVLDGTGSLDRGALRRLVMEDAEARERLEAIVHPEVQRLRRDRRAEAAARGARVLVEEIPLLYEVGLEGEFDVVVAVDAPLEVRRERVQAARGLGPEEFEAVSLAQWPPETKRRRADYVVWNGGTQEELEREAREVWDAILEGDRPGEGEGGARSREVWEVDLHMHTRYSYDCLTDPADVVARARQVGLDRIAITDHDEIDGALEARESAPDLVIVGEEVRTGEGLDLIGLFLSRRIPPGGPFRDVAAEIRRQGGIVYLPHPFDFFRGGDEEFLEGVVDCLDLVEGFNARVHLAAGNRRAREWARRHGLPLGAGSDAHTLTEIGGGRLRLPPFGDPREFVASAARGTVEGRRSGWWVHLGSTWAKVRRRLGP